MRWSVGVCCVWVGVCENGWRWRCGPKIGQLRSTCGVREGLRVQPLLPQSNGRDSFSGNLGPMNRLVHGEGLQCRSSSISVVLRVWAQLAIWGIFASKVLMSYTLLYMQLSSWSRALELRALAGVWPTRRLRSCGDHLTSTRHALLPSVQDVIIHDGTLVANIESELEMSDHASSPRFQHNWSWVHRRNVITAVDAQLPAHSLPTRSLLGGLLWGIGIKTFKPKSKIGTNWPFKQRHCLMSSRPWWRFKWRFKQWFKIMITLYRFFLFVLPLCSARPPYRPIASCPLASLSQYILL